MRNPLAELWYEAKSIGSQPDPVVNAELSFTSTLAIKHATDMPSVGVEERTQDDASTQAVRSDRAGTMAKVEAAPPLPARPALPLQHTPVRFFLSLGVPCVQKYAADALVCALGGATGPSQCVTGGAHGAGSRNGAFRDTQRYTVRHTERRGGS